MHNSFYVIKYLDTIIIIIIIIIIIRDIYNLLRGSYK
jgi:hypothetical protein